MLHVLSRGRSGCRWSWTGFLGVLAGFILLLDSCPAMGQAPAKKAPTAPAAKADDDKSKDDDDDTKAAAAPDVAAPPVDPSQTRRVEQIEVFKDPIAANLLNMNLVTPTPTITITDGELAELRQEAANPNMNPNRQLLDKVVRGLVGQLTDKKNIHELLRDPPEPEAPKAAAKKGGAPARPARPEGDAGKAIEKATSDLLDLVFKARASKNDAFLTAYRRILLQYLQPLLKNHLVPRVQAMIVLGEAASPEYLPIFEKEIASRGQALWVKLWAIEGITNIKKGGGRFPADQESKVARTISEFLERQKELPWPIQYRGLEALGVLRQAGLPTQMDLAHMANTAMLFLADSDARIDVRCEAARTLGLMHLTGVRRINFKLVAYWAGQIAADLATQFNDEYPDKAKAVDNLLKARSLAALMLGPVYQCFDGTPGESNSGLLQMIPGGDSDSRKYVQKIFDMLKAVAQESMGLYGAPPLQYKDRKQKLTARIAALRKFLQENPPENRRLTERGREYGAAGDAAAGQFAPAQPLAGIRRGP